MLHYVNTSNLPRSISNINSRVISSEEIGENSTEDWLKTYSIVQQLTIFISCENGKHIGQAIANCSEYITVSVFLIIVGICVVIVVGICVIVRISICVVIVVNICVVTADGWRWRRIKIFWISNRQCSQFVNHLTHGFDHPIHTRFNFAMQKWNRNIK